MQTNLLDTIKTTEQGQEAEAILRSCVHCGMCNATCPTYQLLGDELDGPRGRIYLIKQVLEGAPATVKTQTHLDRCLTCMSCETTCPSGVQYGRLLEIGRELIDSKVGRSWSQKIMRMTLRNGLSNPRMFQRVLSLGRLVSAVLPQHLREYAGIEKDVTFTSSIHGFRAWDKRVWDHIFAAAEQALMSNPDTFSDVDI